MVNFSETYIFLGDVWYYLSDRYGYINNKQFISNIFRNLLWQLH